MSRYAKFIVALIPFVIATLKVLSDALGDGIVSPEEYIAMLITLLGAIGVYSVPNRPPAGKAHSPSISEQGR